MMTSPREMIGRAMNAFERQRDRAVDASNYDYLDSSIKQYRRIILRLNQRIDPKRSWA